MQSSCSSPDGFRCGSIAILGRPNVGKSTLLNACIQKKISITSKKPQTTWYPILGIHSDEQTQYIFYDTPGFQTRYRDQWHLGLNQIATSYDGLDVLLLVLEAKRLTPDDQRILTRLATYKREKTEAKILCLVNKIDLQTREEMLPWLQTLSQTAPSLFDEIFPLSARRPSDIQRLLTLVRTYLPLGNPLYTAQQDLDLRFYAAEILREKIFRLTGDELPYTISVTIDRLEKKSDLQEIFATIWVRSLEQKKIIIGTRGEKLKRIASSARISIEKLFANRVFLNTWVKLQKNSYTQFT